jgi:hypothetical protein
MDPISDDELTSATFSRRRILAVGAFSVTAAALVAACAPDKPKSQVPEAGVAPSTTAIPEQVVSDDVLLRTGSSMEHSIVDAYTQVLALNVLPPATAALVRRFLEHHTSYATFLEDTTRDTGGEPFTEANAALNKNIIDPALKDIADAGNDPADLAWFVYGLENVSTGTYQSFVPLLHVPALRGAVMTVGGATARQAAIAAGLIPTVVPVPPPEELLAAAPTATTTTIPGATTTTTPANLLIPVAQVPGAFGSLTPVSVAIVNNEEAWNLLGPNSYEYIPEPTTTTT